MRASRGGSGRRAAALPSSVMRPSASIAPSSRSSALPPPARPPAADRGRRARRDRRRPMRRDRARSRTGRPRGFPAGVRLERGGLRLVPQPVADAGLGAAGAAAPLVGGGARHPHGLEPGQADVRLVARHARQPAIDHDAHALDGERGLGDRGREHDLAPAGRRRRDGPVLHVGCRARRRAVRRRSRGRRCARAAASRCGGSPPAPGRKTSTEPARPQRAHHRIGDLPLDRRADRGRDSGSRPERRGPRSRSPAHRRAAADRAPSMVADITRSLRSSRRPSARRAPAPGRDRHRASARGTRRTARRRRRRATDRRDHAA